MHDGLLPLFPLPLVLLPRNRLPLHIFEDRYKEMVGEAIREGSEFGIVLASGGGIVSRGCSAAVADLIKEYGDGRMDIVVEGRRRFTISSLNHDRQYLCAAVEFFEDVDSEAPIELRRRAASLAGKLPGGPEAEEADLADPELSFVLAQPIDDLELRQQLLGSRSEPERLRRLAGFLPGYLAKAAQVAHTKAVAQRNGHGRLPGDLTPE